MFSLFKSKKLFDNNFKLYSTKGQVVYSEEVPMDKILNKKFYFMDFFNRGLVHSQLLPRDINIQKTIQEINERTIDGESIFSIRSIMVLDDEQSLLDCYKMYLTRLNHYVEDYKQVEEGENVLAENPHRFDAVLTDNNMPPGITGSAFAKKIYNNYNQDLAVYIITGNTQDVDRDIFEKAENVRGTIAKPIKKFTFSMSIGSGYTKKIQELSQAKKVA